MHPPFPYQKINISQLSIGDQLYLPRYEDHSYYVYDPYKLPNYHQLVEIDKIYFNPYPNTSSIIIRNLDQEYINLFGEIESYLIEKDLYCSPVYLYKVPFSKFRFIKASDFSPGDTFEVKCHTENQKFSFNPYAKNFSSKYGLTPDDFNSTHLIEFRAKSSDNQIRYIYKESEWESTKYYNVIYCNPIKMALLNKQLDNVNETTIESLQQELNKVKNLLEASEEKAIQLTQNVEQLQAANNKLLLTSQIIQAANNKLLLVSQIESKNKLIKQLDGAIYTSTAIGATGQLFRLKWNPSVGNMEVLCFNFLEKSWFRKEWLTSDDLNNFWEKGNILMKHHFTPCDICER